MFKSMGNKVKWIKPNGFKIETDDSQFTLNYCESIGWKRAKRAYTKKVKALDGSETSPSEGEVEEPIEANVAPDPSSNTTEANELRD